jgi:hypothetical protein
LESSSHSSNSKTLVAAIIPAMGLFNSWARELEIIPNSSGAFLSSNPMVCYF